MHQCQQKQLLDNCRSRDPLALNNHDDDSVARADVAVPPLIRMRDIVGDSADDDDDDDDVDDDVDARNDNDSVHRVTAAAANITLKGPHTSKTNRINSATEKTVQQQLFEQQCRNALNNNAGGAAAAAAATATTTSSLAAVTGLTRCISVNDINYKKTTALTAAKQTANANNNSTTNGDGSSSNGESVKQQNSVVVITRNNNNNNTHHLSAAAAASSSSANGESSSSSNSRSDATMAGQILIGSDRSNSGKFNGTGEFATYLSLE